MYFLQQMELESTAYNMSQAIPLAGELDIKKLERVFLTLIERHEILRSSIHMVNGEPLQRIHDDVDFKIEYFEVPGTQGEVEVKGDASHSPQHLIKNFVKPFDLSLAPLLRVGFKRTGENQYILLLDMHHIITDGVSMNLFEKEFILLYEGKKLTPLRLQYKDYAKWQKDLARSGELKKQEEYWLRQYEGEVPILNVPIDYERPMIQTFEGSSYHFDIGTEETSVLKKIALDNEATFYMILLAVYNIFLTKICGQEDVVVGTPVTGRMHGDLEWILGMFVNTLALRNYPGREKTFQGFLKEVRERTLEAFENQGYPFEDLVKKVSEHREPGRNPLFDVMFAYQNVQEKNTGEIPGDEPGLENIAPGHEYQTAQFDLILNALEGRGKVLFVLEYNTRLFKEETIAQFVIYFKEIVSTVIENKTIKLGEIAVARDFVDIESNISDEEGDFGF
jgi:hypothetical protein